MAILYRVSKLPEQRRRIRLVKMPRPLDHDEGFLLFHQFPRFEFPEDIVSAKNFLSIHWAWIVQISGTLAIN
jgi:hypothetical protein